MSRNRSNRPEEGEWDCESMLEEGKGSIHGLVDRFFACGDTAQKDWCGTVIATIAVRQSMSDKL